MKIDSERAIHLETPLPLALRRTFTRAAAMSFWVQVAWLRLPRGRSTR